MWQDDFWLGGVPGRFDDRSPNYRAEESQSRRGYAHNDYLQTIGEWGLVGTSLIAVSWVLLFMGVFKTWKFVCRESNVLAYKPGKRAGFVYGAAIGLTAILIHSFVDFNMHVPANAILAVMLMALLSGHLRFASEGYWVNPRLWGRIALATIGLGSLVYLGKQGWRHAREYVWLDRA